MFSHVLKTVGSFCFWAWQWYHVPWLLIFLILSVHLIFPPCERLYNDPVSSFFQVLHPVCCLLSIFTQGCRLLHPHLSWPPPTWILQRQLPLIRSSSSVLLCSLTLSSDVFKALAAFLLSWAPQFWIIWALYLASKFIHMTFAWTSPFYCTAWLLHPLSSLTCDTFWSTHRLYAVISHPFYNLRTSGEPSSIPRRLGSRSGMSSAGCQSPFFNFPG